MKKYTAVFCAILLIAALVLSSTGCDLLTLATTTTTQPDKQNLADTKEVLAVYYDELIANALRTNPAVSTSRTLDVKDIKVMKRGTEETSGYSNLKTALEQAKKLIMTNIKDVKIEPKETQYGEDIGQVFYINNVRFGDLVGIKSGEFSKRTEKNVNTNEDEVIVNENQMKFVLDDIAYPAAENSKIGQLFKTVDVDKALNELAKVKDYLQIGERSEFSFAYNGCNITVDMNRKEDQITSMTIEKRVSVVAPAKAVGTLESLGEVDVHLVFVDTTKFSFDWTDPNATTTQAEKKTKKPKKAETTAAAAETTQVA